MMASSRADHVIDIIGGSIPATEGTATYRALLQLQQLHGQTYQTFRDLAGGPKGTPRRNFSPSAIIKHAEAVGFARLVPPTVPPPSIATDNSQQEDSTHWTDEELRDTLSAYLELLGRELAGEDTNKAEVNRELRKGSLKGRSSQSIEYRMRNFSAFFHSKGMPTIKGYVPAGNIGANVMVRLDALLQQLPLAEQYTPTHDEEALTSRANQLAKVPNIPPPVGTREPSARSGTTTTYARSPAIVAYVLSEANGSCEACGALAPFSCDDGRQYLEVHHVLSLADGGPDTIDNTAAVCPNCHRALHYSSDRHERARSLITSVPRLVDYFTGNQGIS